MAASEYAYPAFRASRQLNTHHLSQGTRGSLSEPCAAAGASQDHSQETPLHCVPRGAQSFRQSTAALLPGAHRVRVRACVLISQDCRLREKASSQTAPVTAMSMSRRHSTHNRLCRAPAEPPFATRGALRSHQADLDRHLSSGAADVDNELGAAGFKAGCAASSARLHPAQPAVVSPPPTAQLPLLLATICILIKQAARVSRACSDPAASRSVVPGPPAVQVLPHPLLRRRRAF